MPYSNLNSLTSYRTKLEAQLPDQSLLWVCCSVSQSCLTLCDPINWSMPGFSDLHYLPEFAQTHVHCVYDAIQTSHPLSSPSPLARIKVFSNELALHISWPEYWNFSFSISPFSEYSGWTGWISLQSKGLSRVFSSTTVWKHQFFGAQPSLWSNSHIHTWLLGKL